MRRVSIIFLVTAIMVLSGCTAAPQAQSSSAAESASTSAASQLESGSAPEAGSAPAVELIVSAAASLTDCMQELNTLYTNMHPEVTLTFNFGASGTLQQQIEQGAPVDVFISAGKKQMSALQEKGLMTDATVKDILENKVVLITPADGEKLESFEALAGDNVKQIGIGEPESVPVGQYTAEVFTSLGLTDTLDARLVYAKDVREVLSWVETGNVQAGIVYETDAKTSDKVIICCAAPEGSHKPVVYPLGVLKDSKHAQEAQMFTEFLASKEAQSVYAKYGFSPVT